MTGVNAVMVCVMASPITDRKVVVHLMPFVRRDSTVYELLQHIPMYISFIALHNGICNIISWVII